MDLRKINPMVKVRAADLSDSEDFEIAMGMERALMNEFEGRDSEPSDELIKRLLTYHYHQRTLFATVDSAEKGYARYNFGHSGEGNIVYFDSLYVEPAARGAGLGKLLLNLAIKESRARGASRIVVVPLRGATGFYEKEGFVRIESAGNGRLPPMHLSL